MPKTGWNPIVSSEFEKPYWVELQRFISEERQRSEVYPPTDQVFSAFHLTAPAELKAVILGQDPYHGPNQAHGLSFSVRRSVPPPPSLKNIHKELASDLQIEAPDHGSLEKWAVQGVLLLNTTLTVRRGEPASHRGKGWEEFTDRTIEAISDHSMGCVFILWGTMARSKKKLIDESRHRVIESAHPSPLSAHRGFLGSKPFSKTNTLLTELGRDPIDWHL